MDNHFYSYWFSGLTCALTEMDTVSRSAVLTHCGRACSNSYTKAIYVEEFALSKTINEFLIRLKKRFPDLQIETKDRDIFFTYSKCGCDLVKNGHVTTPLLCACSAASLCYNWEALLGKDNVQVTLLGSILGGNDCCRLRVHLLTPIGDI